VSGDVLDRVRTIVTRVAGAARVPADASPDTPLGDDGYWLDSVDLLEVILGCEREFGTPLDQEPELSTQALTSIRTLAELIDRKRG